MIRRWPIWVRIQARSSVSVGGVDWYAMSINSRAPSTSPKSSRRYAARVTPGRLPGRRSSIHCAALSASLVITEFGIGVGEEAIYKDIIRYSFVERFGSVQGGGEFVPAQKQPDVDFFAVQVPGGEVEGPLKCVLGLGVEADIGSFACAPGQRHGQEVVAGVLGGFLFDRLSGFRDAAPCGREVGACRRVIGFGDGQRAGNQ